MVDWKMMWNCENDEKWWKMMKMMKNDEKWWKLSLYMLHIDVHTTSLIPINRANPCWHLMYTPKHPKTMKNTRKPWKTPKVALFPHYGLLIPVNSTLIKPWPWSKWWKVMKMGLFDWNWSSLSLINKGKWWYTPCWTCVSRGPNKWPRKDEKDD